MSPGQPLKKLALVGVACLLGLPASPQDDRVAAAVRQVDAVVAQGPFAPQWSSLAKFEVPPWYQDGKFGIFIHWGVYSVPGFGNEWYPRNMYRPEDKT